jgi:hypothetical protein
MAVLEKVEDREDEFWWRGVGVSAHRRLEAPIQQFGGCFSGLRALGGVEGELSGDGTL